ncbi:MAG: pyrimidine/purine nucleoside phosphorylase [Pseudohongiellaceae bacterium]
MSRFENATIVKAANVYFDGKVASRTVILQDGKKVTLGLMQPGDYEFGTSQKEIMEILAGKLEVQLPDMTGWHSISGGQSFEVPANSKFQLKVQALTDYCCHYID